MTTTLAWLLALSLAINGVLFLVAYWRQSDKLTDASYALSFIALAMASFIQSEQTTYHLIALLLVSIWAVRIGGFLLYRVIQAGKDARFDGMRTSFLKFGKFWLGQAVAVWALLIPLTLALNTSVIWDGFALAGLIIWLAGFLIETVADAQKARFNSDPSNKGKWIESGLWRYSRHPNYFGEILVWVGIYMYAVPSLSLSGMALGLVSPLLISVLLLFISGIPILEKNADQRWGKLASYRAYKRSTSLLIPAPRLSQPNR